MSDTTTPAIRTPVPARPWGFWGTSLWMLLSFVLWLAAQFALLVGVVSVWIMHHPGEELDPADLTGYALDGTLFSMMTLIANPLEIAVLMLAARLRRWRIRDYLALTWPRHADFVVGIFLLLVFLVAAEVITQIMGHPHTQAFAVDLYRSAKEEGALFWLALAVIVAAPLAEEIVFRGFAFTGWSQSWLRPAGTILLTSAIWTALHVQYDWFFLTQIFLLGMLFGWLRWSSGSTTLTIILHMITNFVAAVATAVAVEWSMV